jgi:hypothetical protein
MHIIYGTINEEGFPAYGLRLAQASAKDSLGSMPLQTKAFAFHSTESLTAVSDDLFEYAMRLAKIRGWQQMVGPQQLKDNFPFHLQLHNRADGKPMLDYKYKVGQAVDFKLVLDENANTSFLPKRYVYVFLINRNGDMILAYPDSESGNMANQFPKYRDYELLNEVSLFGGKVSVPTGTDNYYLLATDEPIPNYADIFNQTGVRSVGANNNNPFVKLLNMGNMGASRNVSKTPANWRLIKLSVESGF